jgi:hypothetical protein
MQEDARAAVAELTSRLNKLEREREMEAAAHADMIDELLQRVEELENRRPCNCTTQAREQQQQDGEEGRSPTHSTS